MLHSFLEYLLLDVVNGKPKVEISWIPSIQAVGDILHQHGFRELDFSDADQNGYQVDFWYYFTHPTKGRYCLAGSLVYGGVVFRKESDEED